VTGQTIAPERLNNVNSKGEGMPAGDETRETYRFADDDDSDDLGGFGRGKRSYEDEEDDEDGGWAINEDHSDRLWDSAEDLDDDDEEETVTADAEELDEEEEEDIFGGGAPRGRRGRPKGSTAANREKQLMAATSPRAAEPEIVTEEVLIFADDADMDERPPPLLAALRERAHRNLRRKNRQHAKLRAQSRQRRNRPAPKRPRPKRPHALHHHAVQHHVVGASAPADPAARQRSRRAQENPLAVQKRQHVAADERPAPLAAAAHERARQADAQQSRLEDGADRVPVPRFLDSTRRAGM
jgi:hypothetical protein